MRSTLDCYKMTGSHEEIDVPHRGQGSRPVGFPTNASPQLCEARRILIMISMLVSDFEGLVHEVKYFHDLLIVRPACCRKPNEGTLMPP